MPFIKKTNENQIRKVNTGADYHRATPALRDKIHVVTAAEETSGLVNVGFFYNVGTNDLEVTNGDEFYRALEIVSGETHGDYSETSNYEVQFESGIIKEGDVLRFRTTANAYDKSDDNTNDIQQLARDLYGRETGSLTNATGTPVGPKSSVASTYRVDNRGGSFLNEAAIQAAINDAGSDDRTVHITRGDWDIGNDITVPSNITLAVDDGVNFIMDATASFTINGIVWAGAYQIFYGVNNTNATVSTYPRDDAWWGLPQKLYVYNIDSYLGGIGIDATAHVYIRDMDRDTWINCDHNYVDEDKIRFTTAGVAAMIIDDSQRLGLGTPTPSSQLEVFNTSSLEANIWSSGGQASLYLGGDSLTDSAEFRMVDTGDNSYWAFIRKGVNHASQANDLEIGFDSGAFDRYVRFDESLETISFGKNVGVRTLLPSSELDVAASNTDPSITLKRIDQTISNANPIANIDFAGTDPSVDTDTPQRGARIMGRAKEDWATSQCGTGIEFYTCDIASDTLDFRMIINEDGRVGIGDFSATTVETSLHVLGTVMATAFSSSSPLILQVNQTEVMRFTDAANYPVGIGTSLPSSKLDIADSTASATMTLKRIDAGIEDGDSVGTIQFAGTDGATEASPSMAGNINAISRTSWTGGDTASDIAFGTTPSGGTTPSEVMRISYTGRVGIGVQDPVEKLQVNGGINVGDTSIVNQGTIRYHNGDFEGRDSTGWISLTSGSGGGGGSGLWSQGSGNDIYYQPSGDTVIIGASSAMASSTLYIAENNSGARVTMLRDDTSISDADVLSYIDFAGLYDGSYAVPYVQALIASTARGNWSGSNRGACITFITTPEGYTAPITSNSVTIAGVEDGASSYSQILVNEWDPITSVTGVGLQVSSPPTSGPPKIAIKSKDTSIVAGNIVGQLLFAGDDGGTDVNSPQLGASVTAYASQDWSTGNSGTKLDIGVAGDGAGVIVRALTIGQNGHTNIGASGGDEPTEMLEVEGAVKIGTTGALGTANGTILYQSNEFMAYEAGALHDLMPVKTTGTDHYIPGGGLTIGTAAATTYGLSVIGSNTNNSTIESTCSISNALGSVIRLGKSRGTVGSPANINANDSLGKIDFYGYRSSAWVQAASITCDAEEVSGATIGAQLGLWVMETGGALGLALNIWEGGNVGIGIGNTEAVEVLEVDGAVKVGNTSGTNNGSIRWNGSNFQGYKGSWVNLDEAGGTSWAQNGLTDGSVSPSVGGGYTAFYTQNTSSTNITGFSGGTNGQIVYIMVEDWNTKFIHSVAMRLSGAMDWDADEYDTITFMNISGTYHEIGRSLNS